MTSADSLTQKQLDDKLLEVIIKAIGVISPEYLDEIALQVHLREKELMIPSTDYDGKGEKKQKYFDGEWGNNGYSMGKTITVNGTSPFPYHGNVFY